MFLGDPHVFDSILNVQGEESEFNWHGYKVLLLELQTFCKQCKQSPMKLHLKCYLYSCNKGNLMMIGWAASIELPFFMCTGGPETRSKDAFTWEIIVYSHTICDGSM